MANPEHLEILRQGVDVWNRWREENSEIIPDLTEANLSDAIFAGNNLDKADLSGAKLLRANLIEVNIA